MSLLRLFPTASAAMARLRSTLAETEIQIETEAEIETIIPAGDNPMGGEVR